MEALYILIHIDQSGGGCHTYDYAAIFIFNPTL
jgi:hypothetical protein